MHKLANTRDTVLIAYAQMSPINADASTYNKARDLNFGQSLHIHPYLMHARREVSGETAHMRRLA